MSEPPRRGRRPRDEGESPRDRPGRPGGDRGFRGAGPGGPGGRKGPFKPARPTGRGSANRSGPRSGPRPGPPERRHGFGFGDPGDDRPWERRWERPPGGHLDRAPGGERPARPTEFGPGPRRGRPDEPRPIGPGRRGPRPADGSRSFGARRPARPIEPLGPDEELVAGRRPVEEAFAAGRPARRLLVTPQRRHALEQIVLHATTLRIPIVEVEGGSLTAAVGFDGHQGVAVVVSGRRFASLEEILARAIERQEPPFVLVLDSLEDPQNLGTLLRSAEAAGVHGVVFPTARQAPLSPAAVKASAGATEHLLLAPVDDLPAALADLHVRGIRIVGSEAGAPLTARQADLRGPTAIVVGSEGHGLGPAVRRRCDLLVRIPMRGQVGSLNAAVAGSILLFEALGQRDPDARPPRTATAPPPPVGDTGLLAD